MKVKPAQGQMVRHPEPPFRFLLADGEEVPETAYWRRRLADREVVLAVDGEEKKKPARTDREAGRPLDTKEDGR